MARVLLVGHSHVHTFGFGPAESALLVPLADDRFEALTGTIPRDEAYWSEIVTHAAGRELGIVWGGNEHYSMYMMDLEPPFDVVIPEQPDLDVRSEAIVLPVTLIRQTFNPPLKELAELLQRLKSVPGCHPFLIGTPPPIFNEAPIQALISKENELVKLLARNFGLDLATARPTPRLLMYKLWVILQSMIKEVAEQNGISFLPIPACACTENGFLRDEYAQQEDFTHANARYGAMMRDYVFQTLQAQRRVG